MRMKYYPGSKIVLKPNVVPHIFECQPERTHAQKPGSRPLRAKRARKSIVEGIISSSGNEQNPLVLPSDTGTLTTEPISSEPAAVQSEPTAPQDALTQTHLSSYSPESGAAAEILCSMATKPLDNSEYCETNTQPMKADKFVQATPSFADKLVQAKPYIRSKFTQCDIIPSKKAETSVKASSPIKIPSKGPVRFAIEGESFSSGTLSPSLSSPAAASSKSSTCGKSPALSSLKTVSTDYSSDSDNDPEKPKFQRDLHLKAIRKDPMHYIGVPLDLYYLVEVFAKCIETEPMHVLMILQKIRQDRTFKSIAYDYEVSESYASKVFSDHIPQLAKCLEAYIIWPAKEEILFRLPVPFRARYSNVQSIIDCFEVEIQKPSDPVHQTLTFSKYKKCNTEKYEISCTPDGLINHISPGFGGRTSDAKVVEKGGFLDKLPSKCAVMADRGFKGIAPLLEKKGCTLVHPPSVKANEKSSKDEVRDSKRISSLRIHIERVIRRVREYEFLKPHACVNHNLLKYLDCVVVIVCSLVNLQNPLIKKCV